MKDDQDKLSLYTEAKKKAWKEHYDRLLNTEFPWSVEDLPPVEPVAGA